MADTLQGPAFGGYSYGMYPPELQQQAAQIARRQAIASIMAQRSLQQPETQHVRSGNVSIPIRQSPFTGLAHIAGAYMAGQGMGEADRASMDLAGKYQTGVREALMSHEKRRLGQQNQLDPQEVEQTQDQGTPLNAYKTAPDPRGAAVEAMMSHYGPMHELGKLEMQQFGQRPITVNKGSKELLVHPVTVETLASFDKEVSPDVAYRQAAEDVRHATPSGSAQLTDDRTREMYGLLAGQIMTPSPELVKAIGTGDIPLGPPPVNSRNPMVLSQYSKLVAAVKEKYPDWSEEMHPAIKKTVESFATGKQGDIARYLGAAADHLETYEQLAQAMKNNDLQRFNKLAAAWSRETGNPAPTNLDAASQIIGNEIVKGITGAPGAEHDRAAAQAAFSAKLSPDQAIGTAQTVRKLLGGQFRGLEQQWQAGTYNRRGSLRDRHLSPAAKRAFDAAGPAKGGGGAAPAGVDPAVWGVMTEQEKALWQ